MHNGYGASLEPVMRSAFEEVVGASPKIDRKEPDKVLLQDAFDDDDPFGFFGNDESTTKSSSTTSSSPTSPAPITAVQRATMKARTERFARLNIKYKNDCGRTVTIAMSSAIHHDQKSNRILNVTIPCYRLAALERSENIEWVDQKGAVYFIS